MKIVIVRLVLLQRIETVTAIGANKYGVGLDVTAALRFLLPNPIENDDAGLFRRSQLSSEKIISLSAYPDYKFIRATVMGPYRV